MSNFLAELKRRHIFRVAAAYAVVAWVLLQLFNNLTPIVALPNWVGILVLVLLTGGLPVAILFAWIHQLAPTDGAVARGATGKLDWFLAGVLIVVIALMSYQQLAPLSPTRLAQVQTGVEAAREASAAQAGISIVVLPFENLSGDAAQEFFSNGMTEEITAALAKVSGLNVVARTSAFQFKAQNRDIQSIGQQLHASHFIEGSVRKAGTRVRITAQLIAADSGVHVWAENYDRELTDVFAIQEEIATAIANALRVPLGLKAGQKLVSNRTSDTDSYQDYLRARALVRVRGLPSRIQAAGLLERAVARDPNYAPAWGMLGQAYAAIAFPEDPAASLRSTDEIRRVTAESLQKAEAAAQKAIRLDPNHIDGYTALALARNYRGQFVQAEDLYKQALSMDPGNPEALNQYSLMLVLVGRLKDSLGLRLRLKELEPFVASFNGPAAGTLALNGRNDEAMAFYQRGLPRTAAIVAELYASMGRYSEAADTLRGIPSGSVLPGAVSVPPGAVEEAIRLLRNAPAQTPSPEIILKGTPFAFVYVYAGTPERVLEKFEPTAENGLLGDPQPGFLWGALYAPVRKTERFKAFVRKIGLVDYWKARGWPEFCHPTTGDDFVCG